MKKFILIMVPTSLLAFVLFLIFPLGNVILVPLAFFLGYRIRSEEKRKENFLDTFLRLLEGEEAEVLKIIIESGGEVVQSDISKKVGKVKA